MTTVQILQHALHITTTKPRLWLLGVVLSAGFGFHLWYASSLVNQTSQTREMFNWLSNFQQPLSVLVLGVVSVLAFILINYLKLIFLFWLHQILHQQYQSSCRLCDKIKSFDGKDNLIARLVTSLVLMRTMAISLITLIISSGAALLVKTYIQLLPTSSFTILILFLGVVLLIIISLWNLFTVLGFLFFRLNIEQASALALDFLTLKFKAIAELVVVLTTIFLIAVSVGSVVTLLIPQGLISTFGPLIGRTVEFQSFISGVSMFSFGLFILWMAINNVFFNSSLVIFFDQHVHSLYDSKREPVANASG